MKTTWNHQNNPELSPQRTWTTQCNLKNLDRTTKKAKQPLVAQNLLKLFKNI